MFWILNNVSETVNLKTSLFVVQVMSNKSKQDIHDKRTPQICNHIWEKIYPRGKCNLVCHGQTPHC